MKRRGCKGCPAEYNPCLWQGAGDNPAHLIVVGSNPSGFSIGKKAPFYGSEGRMFSQLLDTIKKYNPGTYDKLQVYYSYGVLAGSIDPTAEHIRNCQRNILGEVSKVQGIDGREPVVVTIGDIALKSIGVRFRKISDVVGRTLTMTNKVINGLELECQLKVVPLFRMAAVKAKPGYAGVATAAILQAMQMATGQGSKKERTLAELSKDYVYPKTIEELRDLVTHIINYTGEGSTIGPEGWAIAVDTETNTLRPGSNPNPKTLMISVAWDRGKATTILLDHDETPYDKKEAWKEVRRLLLCPKPKAFHNWKYDRKFLDSVNAIPVHRVVWDTLTGEHFLDEDKKGWYSLKKLTNIYAPEYTGYDDDLQAILRGGNSDDDVGVVFMSEKKVTAQVTAPEGRDQDDWDTLVGKITAKELEKKKPKDEKDKDTVKALNADITMLYKQLDMKKAAKKTTKKKDGGFEDIPLETILVYAAVDADVTRIIMKCQYNRLHRSSTLDDGRGVMKYIYLPLSKTLGDMEFGGFCLDQEHLSTLEKDVGALMKQTETELKAKFNPEVNYRSPSQVTALMNRLNFGRIDGADPSTSNKETLDRYAEYYPEGDPRKEFARTLLEFRQADKTKNGFLKKLRKLSHEDSRIHCGFNLNGTATGRLSSSNPNMQNIPARTCRFAYKNSEGEVEVKHPGFNIKKLFIPADPDNQLIVNADIKGAELRVYTAYSDDDKMIEALRSGLDVHSFTTSKIYNLDYEYLEKNRDTDKELKKKRDAAKRVVFGTFYGAGPKKIAEQINGTKEEAQEIINLLYREFPALKRYVEETKQRVRRDQFVKTHFGRYRRFRLAHTSRENFAEACREAVNFLIQSTASDLVLSQLHEVSNELPALGGRMVGTVHDSMTFEIPKSLVNIEERTTPNGRTYLVDTIGKLHDFLDKWIVNRVADKYPWLPVPFLYDVEIGPSYGEVREVLRDDRKEGK